MNEQICAHETSNRCTACELVNNEPTGFRNDEISLLKKRHQSSKELLQGLIPFKIT